MYTTSNIPYRYENVTQKSDKKELKYKLGTRGSDIKELCVIGRIIHFLELGSKATWLPMHVLTPCDGLIPKPPMADKLNHEQIQSVDTFLYNLG